MNHGNISYIFLKLISANTIFSFIHSKFFNIEETPKNWNEIDGWSPSLKKLKAKGINWHQMYLLNKILYWLEVNQEHLFHKYLLCQLKILVFKSIKHLTYQWHLMEYNI